MDTTSETSSRATLIQRARVPLGFLFGIVFVVFSKPTPTFFAAGTLIAMTGLILRLWAAGCLQKHRELCVGGPYRWTRNPLYLGSFVMGAGFSVASAQIWLLALFVLLFIAVYMPVIRREQVELRQAYGRKYGDYLEQVPVFFPSFRPVRKRGSEVFSWRQALKNREYNAVIGFFAICGVLAAKVLYAL